MRRSQFSVIWIATALLFLISGVLPGGLARGSVLTMLSYGSILTVASIGQMFVVQQRGIDFSVIGVMTLAAVVTAKFPANHGSMVIIAAIVVLVLGVIAGTMNGVLVAVFGITPLVATLGMNALLLGAAEMYLGGSLAAVPGSLARFSSGALLGVPILLYIAVGLGVIFSLLMRGLAWGRELTGVGANPLAARASGVSVNRYQIASYMIAAVCYAIAGFLLAGYIATPSTDSGVPYLLATITVVVLGGTPLTGGRSSVMATVVAALFLSQLDQLVLSLGAPTSVQYVIQSVVIAGAMALRVVGGGARSRFRRRPRADPASRAEASA